MRTFAGGAPGAGHLQPGCALRRGERSPFTYGLETELRKLAQLDEDAVRDSALGFWLRGESVAAEPGEDRPILELLPLNTEQRQAVVQGLSAPLTVVTGPPGTGKSQVVISLLANMAWQGGSVLFASKNNHAVDVVETRANELGPFPWLLRVGKEEHHARLAQVLTAEPGGDHRTGRSGGLCLAGRAPMKRAARGLRRAAGDLRPWSRSGMRWMSWSVVGGGAKPFERERFAAMRSLDVDGVRRRLDSLAVALDSAREGSQATIARLLQTRRSRRVAEAAGELRGDAGQLGLHPPAEEEDSLEVWDEFHRALAVRLDLAARAQAYWQAFDKLRSARPLEELAGDLTRIADESAQNSRRIVAPLAAPVAQPLGAGAAQTAG